ncbi:MAG TPA: lycopene cyclase domain-containing protein [Candidatus Aminicenantes bacterium]|nr:lycopene cyclase domain-containing protein [Candidatus Aminicenantes bacterium]HDT13663.1 lycopene cyclase domain-containing protein [Candidatus Aminicenantes bacterium]
MSRYLLIDLAIISGPLLFSFWRPVRYYRRFPALLFAIATVGTVYLSWDHWVTVRGDWAFNPEYLLGIKLFSLPLEEYLFFVVVPFSCIFIYEVLRAKSRERRVRFTRWAALALSVLFFAGAAAFFAQDYTRLVLASCGLFFLVAGLWGRRQLASSYYWLYILISYAPFLLFNHLLTAPPIVSYNPAAIWGFRILSIPLEDFFYSFSMLSFFLMAYLAVRGKD